MILYLRLFLLVFILFTSAGCNQKKQDDTTNQFQERLQAIKERQGIPHEKTDTLTPNPAELNSTEPFANSQPAARNQGDKVIAVKDGDTIELLRNGKKETIRLYGVDAPEKAQDFGQKAKQFVSDLVFNKYVRLIPHNTDRYGRTVGTIILQDGRSLNEELIRNGFAWHYKAYSKDKNLETLEADARRFKRGLWHSTAPTPPWDFRKNKRTAKQTGKELSVKTAAVLPAGATRRNVYFCNSSGSVVYHLDKTCSVLKRCKTEVLTVTEAKAIQEHGRRADKTCSN